MSFNFMALDTFHSDFGAPKTKSLSLFSLFPHLFAISDVANGSDGTGYHDCSFMNIEF